MESRRKKPNGGLGARGAEAAPRFFFILFFFLREISYVLTVCHWRISECPEIKW